MRALTTGEHKTLDLRSETEILLAHRIDNLEHALSLEEGCYSPHRIAFENHQLITENNQLTERIAQLDATIPPAVREAAVRLEMTARNGAWRYPTVDAMNADILLICQHVLGRGQV